MLPSRVWFVGINGTCALDIAKLFCVLDIARWRGNGLWILFYFIFPCCSTFQLSFCLYAEFGAGVWGHSNKFEMDKGGHVNWFLIGFPWMNGAILIGFCG